MNNATMQLTVCDILPPYATRIGEASQPYDCDYGNTAVSILGTNVREFEAFLSALNDLGATVFDENKIAQNRFATYLLQRDGTEYTIHLSFYPITCNVRIVWGARQFLPTQDDAVFKTGSGRTSVLQYTRNGVYNSQPATGAPGEAYIVTLADGSFLLIDGGPRQKDHQHFTKRLQDGIWVDGEFDPENDCDKLYRLLLERTPAGQKPVIAAWLFTHAHSDHTDLAADFAKKYGSQVEIKLSGYNFPEPLVHPTKFEKNEILTLTKHFVENQMAAAGAVRWIMHAGQRLSLPGCEVEVLHTHEDFCPKSFPWLNHTSAAFRLKFAGKTFMVPGDCEKEICQLMADKYGAALKSDVLQIVHHGANGCCTAFYAAIDPDICLWPVDAFRFYTDSRMLGVQRNFEYNALLRCEDIRHREHYHNCEDVEIFMDC